MNKYEVIENIGEGGYGIVLKCRNRETGELVAIKRFKDSEDDEQVHKTTLREVKVLRMLKEESYIVKLLEAFRRKGKLYLVFNYVGVNLLEVLEKYPSGLEMSLVKKMTFTMLLAMRSCHVNGIIHRDIKPENLLVEPSDMTLRLCDFGFARVYDTSMNDLTDYVATRWYRSPELLLGTTNYGLSSDLWAAGCIMAELIDGQPIFPGESELDQIFLIQKLLGNYTPQQIDVFRTNKRFAGYNLRDIAKTESTLERKYGRKAGKRAVHLLKSLLVIDPTKRLTIEEAVQHPFFEGLAEEFCPTLALAPPISVRPSTANRSEQNTSQPKEDKRGFLPARVGSAHRMAQQVPIPTQQPMPMPTSKRSDLEMPPAPQAPPMQVDYAHYGTYTPQPNMGFYANVQPTPTSQIPHGGYVPFSTPAPAQAQPQPTGQSKREPKNNLPKLGHANLTSNRFAPYVTTGGNTAFHHGHSSRASGSDNSSVTGGVYKPFGGRGRFL